MPLDITIRYLGILCLASLNVARWGAEACVKLRAADFRFLFEYLIYLRVLTITHMPTLGIKNHISTDNFFYIVKLLDFYAYCLTRDLTFIYG